LASERTERKVYSFASVFAGVSADFFSGSETGNWLVAQVCLLTCGARGLVDV